MQMPTAVNSLGWKIAQMIGAGLLTIALAIGGWTANKIGSLEEQAQDLRLRLVAIEANRFTAKDGQKVWERLSTVPVAIPPEWWVKLVESMELRLNKRLDSLEIKLRYMERARKKDDQ